MKDVIVIYDDITKPGKEIRTITGDKTYGETILKRVALVNRIKEEVQKNAVVTSFYSIKDEDGKKKLKQDLTNNKAAILYLYSNFGIIDSEQFQSLITKAVYVNEVFVTKCNKLLSAVLLPSVDCLFDHIDELESRVIQGDVIDVDAFVDLSDLQQFLTYITSGFDARFFNSLQGDEHTVTKKSSKIEKIKSEYNFYYLLPDDMKMWFVMPYNYKEDASGASYTMERFHMTDIAIRFVHGAVSTQELSDILDKLFYFVTHRKSRAVSSEEARKVADSLYIDKLESRMKELKQTGKYDEFDRLIRMGTEFDGIEQIVNLYKQLYQNVMKKNAEKEACLVVGHGDLCFSNILYSKEADLLKLIDPKGALKEEDLYTDVYYDLAKLSHSICGSYDFFNSGLYQVGMDRDMKWHLSVDTDATQYKQVFKEKLAMFGFSYEKVRVLEAGLFLSMLPYHMDQPGKVFGFILNAISILKEVESCIAI